MAPYVVVVAGLVRPAHAQTAKRDGIGIFHDNACIGERGILSSEV